MLAVYGGFNVLVCNRRSLSLLCCCKGMKNPRGKSRAVSFACGLAWLPIEDAPCAKAAVLVQPVTAGALYLNVLASPGSSVTKTGLL